MKKYFMTADSALLNCGAIRSQIDYLQHIFILTQYLLAFSSKKIKCKEDMADIIVWVDKMSRIFIDSKNKIHCYHYPFVISESNGGFTFKYFQKKIDAISINVLTALLKGYVNIEDSCEEAVDYFWQIMDEFEIIEETDKQWYWRSFLSLLTVESGYLRFDHDESVERIDEVFHPIDHIDFYYSNTSTFKLGLSNRITCMDLRKIVDINERCYRLDYSNTKSSLLKNGDIT